jgi:hypothetical protein
MPMGRMRIWSVHGFALLLLAAGLSACIDSGGLVGKEAPGAVGANPLDKITFMGCTGGVPVNATSARVEFDFPEGVEKINVYIDGTLAGSSNNRVFTSYTDRNLTPNTSYTFYCEAQIGEYRKIGPLVRTIVTPALGDDSPVAFPGIDTAVSLSPSSMRVTWTNPTGLVASKVKIFLSAGSAVDWIAAPVKEASYSLMQATLTGLGDQVPYSVGIRACNAAGACEENVIQRSITLADGGAPQTQGAISATYIPATSSALVEAPWSPSDGGIAHRHVYVSGGTYGNGQGGTNIANYAAWSSGFAVSDAANPPSQLLVNALGTATHYIAIRDEDPAGNFSPINTFAVVNYRGCLSTAALSTSVVRVTFDYPEGADFVRVSENGVLKFTSSDSNVKTFDSTALTEGQTYIYECEMQLNGRLIKGSQRLTQKTASINPPNFQGVTAATALSPSSVRINWNPVGAGVLPSRFVVYANPGTDVDWNATPLDSNVASSATQYTVSGLGDGLPYAFGVRACSETNNCDLNVIKRTLTLADTPNAPTTTGAASAVFSGGVVTVTAPWTHAQGKISKRHVIISTNAGFTSPTEEVIDVVDPLAVPTSLVLTSPFVDNTTYYFRVQDEDGSGLNNNNTNTVSVNSGDLTPPSFDEVKFVNVERSTPQDSAMTVTVTAVNRQPGDSNGVSHYVVFLKSFPEGTENNTACSNGARWAEFDVLNTTHFPSYVVGNNYDLNVTGLSPRTLYGVCVKARDQAGNVSNTNKAVWHRTADVVAPEFVGLGASHADNVAFINDNEEIDVSWKASSSSDASTYNVRVWRGSSTTQTDLQVFENVAHPIRTKKIPRATFAYNDFETLYASVEACDDALSKGYNATANNCTLGPTVPVQVRGFSVPDITPPQGFGGIAEAFPTVGSTATSFACSGGSAVTLSQGEVLACWIKPNGGTGNWADYRGFRVYKYAGGVLTQIGNDVLCSGSGASTSCPTQIKISGLEHYKTYRLHVRAFDAAGAISSYLNPISNFVDARTRDTTAPVWASGANLSVTLSSPPVFSWSAASDNQRDLSSKITYEVFRKQTTPFSNPNSHSVLQSEKDKQFTDRESTQVTDTTQFTEGQKMYYVVCARDSTGNRVCDGSSQKEYIVPDRTKPTITSISVLNAAESSPKTLDDKTYKLKFTIGDNSVDVGNITKSQLKVTIFRKVGTDLSTAVPLDEEGNPDEGFVHYDEPGIEEFFEEAPGPNAHKFIHYIVQVEDLDGNKAHQSVLVESDTRLTLDTTFAVVPAQGLASGGTRIVVHGSGFGNGITIHLDGVACDEDTGSGKLGPKRYNSATLLCKTPARASGTGTTNAALVARNTDGTTATTTFQYQQSGYPNYCDDPSKRTSALNGTGVSPSDPYRICTASQMQTLSALPAASTFNKHIALGDHIDLSGITFSAPIVGPTATTSNNYASTFSGNGYLVENLKISSTITELGFFGRVANGFEVRDVTFVDPLIENTLTTTTGTPCYGAVYSRVAASTVSEVVSNVSVIGGEIVSGFVGASRGGLITGYSGTGSMTDIYAQGTISNVYIGALAVGEMTGGMNLLRVQTSGSVSATEYAGGVIAYAPVSSFTFESVKSDANVVLTLATGTAAAGIVARAGSSGGISFIINNSEFSGTVSGYDRTGGIVGTMDSSALADNTIISNSANRGTVLGRDNTGGIMGYLTDGASLQLTSLKNVGSVEGRDNTGGIVGYLSRMNPATACYADINKACLQKVGNEGTVSGRTNVGGIVGWVSVVTNAQWGFSMDRAYSTGSVTSSDTVVGGLAGYVTAGGNSVSYVRTLLVSNSYNTGSVTTPNGQVGGIFGLLTTYNHPTVSTYNISNVYSSTQPLSPTANDRGGLIGRYTSNSAVMTTFDAFWNSSLISSAFGTGPALQTGVASKTTSELQSSATFAGWDFYDASTNPDGVWGIKDASTPYLKWQECPIPVPAGFTPPAYCN